MTEEAAFLQSILADCRDTTARLVFADWLDEHDRDGSVMRGIPDVAWKHFGLVYFPLAGSRATLGDIATVHAASWTTSGFSADCIDHETARVCAWHVFIRTLLHPAPFTLVTFDTGDVDFITLSDQITLTYPPAAHVATVHYSPSTTMSFRK